MLTWMATYMAGTLKVSNMICKGSGRGKPIVVSCWMICLQLMLVWERWRQECLCWAMKIFIAALW